MKLKEILISLLEDISAEEAHSTIGSIQTLIDKKRGVAFIVKQGNSAYKWKKIQEMIKTNDLQSMYVKGNPGDAYIIYRKGFENDAAELKDIAEKYGGYLSAKATEEDSRRIGELLGYKKEDIDWYINKNYKN